MSIPARLARLEGMHKPTGEGAINAEVFRLAAVESAAERAALQAVREGMGVREEELSRLLADEVDANPSGFAALWGEMTAQYEMEHGVGVKIEGFGFIGEKDYARLRAAVTA